MMVGPRVDLETRSVSGRRFWEHLRLFPPALLNPLIWALPVQAVLLFWRLDLLDPWGDEWHTLRTVPQPLGEIASTLAGNIHPPLYFWLLHFWVQVPLAGTLLTKVRAMSALWALLATVVLYSLWLRREHPRFQRIVLGLWVLCPSLLLYSRMARSYTMQLALALIAIHAAVRWTERPRGWWWFVGYTISCATLCYTHYLPGLAIMAAASLILIVQKRFMAVAASAAVVTMLYLPWLATFRLALSNWTSSRPYRVGNFLADQIVRLGYWFISLSFGEALSDFSVVLASLMTPVIVYSLWGAVRSRPSWLGLVTAAAGIGFVGVNRWSGFPFTPSHVLFALPFFLMLLVRGIDENFRRRSLALLGIAVLYVSGAYNYFAKSGYLNPGYAMPNEEIAATIRNSSPGTGAVVVVDSSFAQPLLDRLGSSVARVILLTGEESAETVRHEVRQKPAIIWFCRRAHDTSSDGLVTRLELELSQNRQVTQYGFSAYTIIQRLVLRWLRGPGQSAYSYRVLEVK